MTSRKDQVKIDYLNSPEGRHLGESIKRHGLSVSNVSDSMLPDDYVFDGWKVVNGQFYKTAGEYKAALDKEYSSSY